MKFTNYINYLIILISFSIVSCSFGTGTHRGYREFNDMLDLKKGKEFNFIKNKYLRVLAPEFELTVYGQKYIVTSFLVSTDIYDYTTPEQKKYVGSGKFETQSLRGTETVKNKVNFILIFENKKLLYYGFLYEFRNSPDKLLKRIAESITERK